MDSELSAPTSEAASALSSSSSGPMDNFAIERESTQPGMMELPVEKSNKTTYVLGIAVALLLMAILAVLIVSKTPDAPTTHRSNYVLEFF